MCTAPAAGWAAAGRSLACRGRRLGSRGAHHMQQKNAALTPPTPCPAARLSTAFLQRPPSAYNLFVKDHKVQIKEELGAGAAGCDIMLRLSGGWAMMGCGWRSVGWGGVGLVVGVVEGGYFPAVQPIGSTAAGW